MGKQQIDKTQMMLAVVSTKSSRVSREEAKWRGKVDYRVAHPERHVRSQKDRNATLLGMMGRVDDLYNNLQPSGTKRRTDEVDTLCPSNNSGTSCKRQRTGHGCSVRDVLSPETIGYISGVLHAEV